MSPEYHAEGKFPFSRGILGIGPRKKEPVIIKTSSEKNRNNTTAGQLFSFGVDGNIIGFNPNFKKELSWSAVISPIEDTDKTLVIRKGKKGNNFTSEKDLKIFLKKKFKITYFRDIANPV